MRFLKTLLLGILSLSAILTTVLVLLGIWIWADPQRAWRVVEKRLLPADLSITWHDLDFAARAESLTRWHFHLAIVELNLNKTAPALHIPLEKLAVDLSIRFFSPSYEIALQSLELIGRQPIVLSLPAKPSSTSEPQGPAQWLPQVRHTLDQMQKHLHAGRLDVHLPDLKVLWSPEQSAKASVQITKLADREQIDFALTAQEILPALSQIDFQGQLQLEPGADNAFLTSHIRVRGPQVKLAGQLTSRFQAPEMVAHFKGTLHAGKTIEARPQVQLAMGPKQAKIEFQTSLQGVPGPLPSFANIRGEVTLPFAPNSSWSNQPAQFDIGTEIALFFIAKNMRPPFEKACQCRIPETLRARLRGKVWPSHIGVESQRSLPVVDAELSLAPVASRLIDLNLGARLVVERQQERYIYRTNFNSLLVLRSFQGLRRFLDTKGVIIPAPLAVLDGEIKVEANGPVRFSQAGLETPIRVAVALRSPQQSVRAEAVVGVRVHSRWRQVHLDVRTKIQDLQLELPPLDPLVALPRLTPDPRLLRAQQTSLQPVRFTFSFAVESEQPNAIRILSELARPYVPLTLKLEQNRDERAGFVELGRFDIRYLRRTMKVESLRVDLVDVDGEGSFPIDGRVQVQQTDYQIFIRLRGTTRAPMLTLSSRPYLPRSEIISVLLFDRTSDHLVGADSETVGSVEAAMADRAIGLLGLWAFSSTPIRSFSYNAITKVYGARLLLDEGLTAEIGTDWESTTNVEVRKRLSRRWVLTASWAPSQEQDEVGKVVLQWERRF